MPRSPSLAWADPPLCGQLKTLGRSLAVSLAGPGQMTHRGRRRSRAASLERVQAPALVAARPRPPRPRSLADLARPSLSTARAARRQPARARERRRLGPKKRSAIPASSPASRPPCQTRARRRCHHRRRVGGTNVARPTSPCLRPLLGPPRALARLETSTDLALLLGHDPSRQARAPCRARRVTAASAPVFIAFG